MKYETKHKSELVEEI